MKHLSIIYNVYSLFFMTITGLLPVLQKVFIKIVAYATYTHFLLLIYTFFYINTLLFCCKIKICCDHSFPQQIRQKNIVELHVLRNYSNVRIGFNMNNNCHGMSLVYVYMMLVSMHYVSTVIVLHRVK